MFLVSFVLILPPSFFLSHLGCHKVSGVTWGEEQAVASSKLLGESKVTDPDGVRISRVIHIQDVTGLQVSMYHLQRKRAKKRKTLEKKSTFHLCSCVYRSVSSPLGNGGSQQSWWWCRAQHWPLSQRKTSAWGSYRAAPLPSSALSPGTHTCPRHTPDTCTRCKRRPVNMVSKSSKNFTLIKHMKTQMLLTSFRVMMLGCCPYRIRISISSEGSLLILSIIWDRWQQRHDQLLLNEGKIFPQWKPKYLIT